MNEANFDIKGAMATAKFNSTAMKALLESASVKEVTLHAPAMGQSEVTGHKFLDKNGQEHDGEINAMTVQTDADINP